MPEAANVIEIAAVKARRQEARFAAGIAELESMKVAQSLLDRIVADQAAGCLGPVDFYLELICNSETKS